MPVKGLSGVPADIRLESLPDPGNRFTLGAVIGSGISGTVYEAVDSQAGKKVAVKVQKIIPDYENDIKEEYKILKYLASHPNLPTFHGAFYKKNEVWFVLQLCEGGPIIDLVRGLYAQNRHLSEEQIAFILRETVKALCHLHENHIIHRDVKASNILLTSTGEIKIVDFGLSRGLKNTLDKRNTCLGSPCWMAPELIISGRNYADGLSAYDNRIDVWALGITALELAEGQAPYEDMHPTRAIFQIVRNPPPHFRLPSKWSQFYADFVSECLIKIPEERPFIFEFLEHPYVKQLPEDTKVGHELVSLKQKLVKGQVSPLHPEVHLRTGRLQRKISEATEAMIVEDLAAIDEVNEDKIMGILHERFNRGLFYTYIGDILVFLNPNCPTEIYGNKYHSKYQWKSRSENSPHIYAVADVAYQDMLHHHEPQNVIFSGETFSGKTANYNHLLDHLLYLGKISNKISDKVVAASKIIQVLGNAATPHNNNSTRHVINTQVTYTTTGKLSGAIFYLYQLEKWRVTGYKCPNQGNFHIFYYFFDSLKSQGKLKDYHLEDKNYVFLNRKQCVTSDNSGGAANDPKKNAAYYTEILHLLEVLEFEPDQIEIVQKILAAIILIGEIAFVEAEDNGSDVNNPQLATAAAALLGLDEKKFLWALCNYCVIHKGNAIRKKQSVQNAIEAKLVLARGLYARLIDFIVNIINLRLSVTRVVLGDKNFVSILDLPGFEIVEQNNLEQLFNNCMNEQLQYFYNQRVFTWELKEQEDEGILLKPLQFYDNKPTVDELMGKPDGLLYVIDEASRSNSGHSFIIDTLANSPRGTRIRKATSTNFTVAHYCKKAEYNATDIPQKNHDFLPPEMIETMRLSSNFVVKQLYTNQFTKSGNLTISTDQNLAIFSGKRKKWGAALVSGDQKSRKFNTEAQGEYSQTRRMRTCAAIYRASSLEVLKTLSESTENSNICFVRCIRAGLVQSSGFEADVVSPQLRSLSILDTTRARQVGYSYRVSFKDFIDRYKFLAFDFDEPVEVSRENCRLLLIRLKMEGWIIGKNKVFLRYYDKEYLSRLYETQVKKIVKIQAVMRKFITKKKVIPRVKSQQSIEDNAVKQETDFTKADTPPKPSANTTLKKERSFTKADIEQKPSETVIVYSGVKVRGQREVPKLKEDDAALVNQINDKSHEVRKLHLPLLEPDYINRRSEKLAKIYFRRWRSRSLFQVLLLYRAKMFHELTNFSQQVHLYNEHTFHTITAYRQYECVGLDWVQSTTYEEFIGDPVLPPLRIPLQLNHRSTFVTDMMYDPFAPKWKLFGENEDWDTPLRSYELRSERFITTHIVDVKDKGIQAEQQTAKQIECEPLVENIGNVQTVEKKYMGAHLQRNISVYSIDVPSEGVGRNPDLMDDFDGFGGSRNSFGRVFMQLMCPSCCGGLFSETKGSVYMKRKATGRRSETKSASTICTEEVGGVVETNNDVVNFVSKHPSSLPGHKMQTDTSFEEEVLCSNDIETPTKEETPSPALTATKQKRCETIEEEMISATDLKSENLPMNGNLKLQKDTTIEEVMDMYAKPRRISLTETISQELNQSMFTNGEIKLRKTCYTNGETNGNKSDTDTVIELKIGGKEYIEVKKHGDDEEPPFNFQAVLRKTNSTRQSLRRFSDTSTRSNDPNYFESEILPGVMLKGIAYDL